MNQDVFEWLIVLVSAPLAGIGLACYLNGDVPTALIAIGTSIKFIVAYYRTPRNLFDSKGYSGTFEEFAKRVGDWREKIDNDKPVLRWLSEFATYITLGGLALLLFELF